MISLAEIIFVAVLIGFLVLIVIFSGIFFRLLVEDWEAVEIDVDELERLEYFIPTKSST